VKLLFKKSQKFSKGLLAVQLEGSLISVGDGGLSFNSKSKGAFLGLQRSPATIDQSIVVVEAAI
jgi:hypothetical protein